MTDGILKTTCGETLAVYYVKLIRSICLILCMGTDGELAAMQIKARKVLEEIASDLGIGFFELICREQLAMGTLSMHEYIMDQEIGSAELGPYGKACAWAYTQAESLIVK